MRVTPFFFFFSAELLLFHFFSVEKSMKPLLVSKNMNMDMSVMSVSSNENVNGMETMKYGLKKTPHSALGFQSLESFETYN